MNCFISSISKSTIMGDISIIPPIGGMILRIGFSTGSVTEYKNRITGLYGSGLIQLINILIIIMKEYMSSNRTRIIILLSQEYRFAVLFYPESDPAINSSCKSYTHFLCLDIRVYNMARKSVGIRFFLPAHTYLFPARR